MTEAEQQALADRLESYAKLLICGEMVNDLRAAKQQLIHLQVRLDFLLCAANAVVEKWDITSSSLAMHQLRAAIETVRK